MLEPEDSWGHEFEAMIDEFSDSETPNETTATKLNLKLKYLKLCY
jgi:hypothetical protein